MDQGMGRGMDRRTFVKLGTAAALTAGSQGSASAQAFPTRPIKIVVPTPAGAPPDVLARVVGNAVAEAEGWTVIIENKPGGAMTIGALEVQRQPADGHTLLSVTTPIAAAPSLIPKAQLDIERGFLPVIRIGTTYNVLVINPATPAKTLGEFVAYLKATPDKYTFSSGGFGTPAHLLGELFKLETGVRTTHVPYQGNSRTIPDLISGINTYQFITAVAVLDLIRTGKLRALTVMSHKRMPALPDVPTVGESGYPKLASEDWAGILARSGTPAPVVARMNAAFNKALTTDKVRQAMAAVGTDIGGGSPEDFGKMVRAEVAHWSKVIKDAGIKVNP